MVPFTYLFDFEHVTDIGRCWAMHEFAQQGAKHLVLTDTLIGMVMQKPNLQKTLLDEMAAEGLNFVDAHSPFGTENDLLNPYEESRPRMLARHRLAMQIASDMGVDTICIHVGNPNWFDTKQFHLDKSFENIRRALDALLPCAEDLKLTICIENIWFPSSTPEFLLKIKALFPTDALGFTYDAGHANIMDKGRRFEDCAARKGWEASGFDEVPWEDHALEKMLPHVVNCHLHDNYGQWDEH
ncbi:MAG: sugar phosphate isomerase/epimerase [Victivallales bacterium]|nr:sugar phosphate isomerase/epimerase [Victivallales bacterium]